MLKLIDKRIRKAFSNAALEYDVIASLHKEIGRELLAKLLQEDKECDFVLDVGMGTGWLTKRLAGNFMEAKVLGLDFSDGMIKKANEEDCEYSIIQANASRLPFKKETFDVVVSNLAYQWLNDLDAAFSQTYGALKSNGRFTFTLFGHDTFKELFEALDKSLQAEEYSICRLSKREEVQKALEKNGFSNINITHEYIKVRFPDMYGLLKWIKDIGANALTRDFYVGKDLLARTNDYYNEHFKDRLGTYTTFEVIWVDAIK